MLGKRQPPPKEWRPFNGAKVLYCSPGAFRMLEESEFIDAQGRGRPWMPEVVLRPYLPEITCVGVADDEVVFLVTPDKEV